MYYDKCGTAFASTTFYARSAECLDISLSALDEIRFNDNSGS